MKTLKLKVMENKVHYITEEGNKFIIAKTYCGKQWDNVEEFTSIEKYVTCEKCKQKINKL